MSTPLGDIPSTTPMSNAAEVAAQIFSLNGSSLSVSLIAGANITFNSGLRSITIDGPAVPAATNFSLNGTSSSVSLVAGANITFNSGASSITIVGPTATNFSLNGTSSSVSLVAGANITINSGASSMTIVGPAVPAVTQFTLNGTTNSVSLIAGANITFNSGANSITIVGPAPAAATDFSLNGTSSSVSLVAGANITINSGASSMTIVGPSVPSITQFTLNGTTNSVSLVAGANITLNSGANSITIVGPTPAAAIDFSLNGTSSSVSLVAGANITLNSGASSITIVGPSVPVANRLTYTQNFPLQQVGRAMAGFLSSTGTTAASATNNPFGSSMSLQRIFIPAAMSLTEVDLAFRMAFQATNSGRGSMSQTFMVFSWGNSTSLASVLSASRAVSWDSGSTTAGTASSLQQGWSNNNIQPFTFAASALPAGEYVVGHHFSWAIATASCSITVLGAHGNSIFSSSAVTNIATTTTLAAAPFDPISVALTAFTAAPVSVNAALTVGTVTASAFTDSSSIGLMAFTDVPINFPALSSNGVGTGNVISNAGTAAANLMRTEGLLGGVFYTSLGAAAVLRDSVTDSVSLASSFTTANLAVVTSVATLTATITIATTTINNIRYNGSLAMTTASTDASYLYGEFYAGILRTGATIASIDLKTTALTASGLSYLAQPWFALCGS